MHRSTGRLSRRQLLVAAAAASAMAAGLSVLGGRVPRPGQGLAEPPLIGWLAPGFEAEDRGVLGFREGLREQGLREGENLRVAWRFADRQPERMSELVAELLDLQVRVLVAGGNTPTQAARQATDRVPIVSLNAGDPVAAGWAVSAARPGGNLTGVGGSAGGGPGLYPKAADLLVECVQERRRLAYLGNLVGSASPHDSVAEVAAQRGLEMLVLDVPRQADVAPAFERARAWGADLLIVQNVIPLNARREQIPELARVARLPAASVDSQWAAAGLLLAYDYDRVAAARRGAWYVARILEGADTAELPFERPTTFTLSVNSATAAHLGLTLPEHVAVQVTEWVGQVESTG